MKGTTGTPSSSDAVVLAHEKERVTMGAKTSNSTIVTSNNKRIAALKKFVTNGKTQIPIVGEQLKPSDLIAVFQDELDKRATVASTKASYETAVAQRTTASQKRQITDDALKVWVLNFFGPMSAEAKEFGYAPRKQPTMTAKDRAAAVDANLATREARGTMGKKAKEKIHGTVVPPTAPAAPANNAAPVATPAPVAVVTNGAATNGAGVNGAAHNG
jgi:hypothetical protein